MNFKINVKIIHIRWYDYTNVFLWQWKSFPAFVVQLDISFVYSCLCKYNFALFFIFGWDSISICNMKELIF